MSKVLHIVSHDVPWPADYGGVVDLFYKLKSLYEEGVRIKLHCFDYRRGRQDELNKYCEEVYYYKRKRGWKGISVNTPYIIQSRANPLLLNKLMADDHPVLLEGIHCTAFLDQLLSRGRKVFLRLHNVESLYYSQLFQRERNFYKKLYFLNESIFLKEYEKRLPPELPVIAVSENDATFYREVFDKKSVFFLPVFIPYSKIKAKEGTGKYCLYHGNLSVAENEKAAAWLLDKIFNDTEIPLIIAGKNPSARLRRKAKKKGNITLVINPEDKELDELIANAQLHVLPSFNRTGIKLKLINALYNGRHCLVNKAAVEGSGLESACHIADDAASFTSLIDRLFQQKFTTKEITVRGNLLLPVFDNRKNAQQLIQWIW